MNRAEALQDMIAAVEAEGRITADMLVQVPALDPRALGADYREQSLDAVARLEAPLRERGWWTYSVNNTIHGWAAVLSFRDADRRWHPVKGEAPTEARARLLAVLRALHHEASR